MAVIVGDEWPLTGRDRLLRAMVTSADGTGRESGIVLSGGAGVGKTRLAREAMAGLASAGRVTEWVSATRSASGIPFGALFTLLPAGGLSESDRLTVLRRLADRFAEMGVNREPPVMVVDDAHLLDDASATVIHHLVNHSLAFILATVRTSEKCPDAVTALWKDGAVRRIELFPLPFPAIENILDGTFHGQLDAISRQKLTRLTAGNPLLLRETLLAALDTGTLRRRAGVWQWTGAVAPTSRLVEVVAGQLGPAREPVTDVLEVIACGEPMPLAILERLADAETITAAERTGLMVIETSGARRVSRLSPPLSGEILRSTMPRTRSAAITDRIAEAVTAMPARRRDDALRVGGWQLRASRTADPEVLLAAAEQAMDRLDLELAERLVNAAGTAGAGWRADQLLARILNKHGRYEESVQALPQLPKPGEAAAHAAAAIVQADMLYWARGNVAKAERALTTIPGHDADGHRCLILLFDSRCDEALRVGETVLRRQNAEPRAVLLAAAGAAAAAGILGRPDRAEAIHRQGLAVAAAHHADLPRAELRISGGFCLGLLACGRLDQASALIQHGYRTMLTEHVMTEDAVLMGALAGFRGAVAKARGELDVAATSLRESLLLLAGFSAFRMTAVGLAELAGTHALTGDDHRSTRLLARSERPDRRTSRLFLPWIERNRIWTLAAGGDISAATAHARHTAALAHSFGQPTVEAWALYDAARLGDARAVRGRLAALAIEIPTPMVAAFTDAATALATDEPDRAVAAGTVFKDLGMLLHAAEALTAAATLYARTGQRSAANSAALQAELLIEHCHEARTPLLDTADLRITLTRREKEVAQLAASGSTSRQIAVRLGLSRRTVDNYLGRVYSKLGVSGRSGLSTLIENNV